MNVHSLARTLPASRALLVERVRGGWTIAKAATAAGISERTAYKWLGRFRAEGKDGLRDRTSRPRRMPARTPGQWETLVVELRRSSRLTGVQIAKRLKLARPTVARILVRHGISRLRLLDPPPPANRYQWPNPGDLIHLDVKKLGRIRGIGKRITGVHSGVHRARGAGWEYVHVCVDDASRAAYVEVLDDEQGRTTAEFLERAVAWFQERGVRVQRVMSDNGPAYRSHAFRAICLRHEMRHIRTRPYTPRTNGKAERFIQTLVREWAYAAPYETSARRSRALPPWLRYYNRRRGHGSLDGQPPLSRIPDAA